MPRPPPTSKLFPYTTLFRSGKKIRFQSATNYAAVIEAQRTHKVDIAQYGPLSYVVARSTGVNATPVAAQTLTKGAQPGYQDRKSTRLNSSHANSSYAGFCLK